MIRKTVIVTCLLAATAVAGLWANSYRVHVKDVPAVPHPAELEQDPGCARSRDTYDAQLIDPAGVVRISQTGSHLHQAFGPYRSIHVDSFLGRLVFTYSSEAVLRLPPNPVKERRHELGAFAYRHWRETPGEWSWSSTTSPYPSPVRLVGPMTVTGHRIRMPYWFFVVLLACYPAVALFRGPVKAFARRRNGFCGRCGYDLSGLPDATCPECGLGFDRNRQERNHRRWEKRAAHAAEWFRGYQRSRVRRVVATVALVACVMTGLLWAGGICRVTFKSPTLRFDLARGHLIFTRYARPIPDDGASPVGTGDNGWSVGPLGEFATIWRPYPLLSGSTIYVPVWPVTLLSAVPVGLIYRPVYRWRWRREFTKVNA